MDTAQSLPHEAVVMDSWKRASQVLEDLRSEEDPV